MIYEYAIAPDFLLDILNEKQMINNIIRAFRQGMALFSSYPQDPLLCAYKQLTEQKKSVKDHKLLASIAKKEQSLILLKQECPPNKYVKRMYSSDENFSFENEHKRFPFFAIMKNSDNSSSLLPYKDIEWLKTLECEFFNHEISVNSERTKEALTKTLAPFLNNSSTLTFIDPYFMVEARYKVIYKKYFELLDKTVAIRCENIPRTVTIVCAGIGDKSKPIPYEEFKNACITTYQPIIPATIKLEVYIIKEKTQEIHDRMILSNIGGVTIGHGTEESKKIIKDTSQTTISILSQQSLANWRKKYTPNSDAFYWSEPIIIEKE